MRAPDRIYFRVPGHSAEAASAAKGKLAQASASPKPESAKPAARTKENE
jgi:hypothetical protein